MLNSYEEALQFLYASIRCNGVKFGLERMRELQECLDYPDKDYPCILVAGTNGKGTLVTGLAAGLEEEGLVVGKYTSPHLRCFRERIQVGGEFIPEKEVVHLLRKITPHGASASFFELTTAMALEYFRLKKVDVAVLEVGLGGRLDATNVVDPDISVVTSIGLDHVAILGDSLESIAREKVAVGRQGRPLIVGPTVPKQIWEHVDADVFPCEEGALAEEVLQRFRPRISRRALEVAKKAKPPCRMQEIHIPGGGAVILDIAHNPPALQRLVENLPCRNASFAIALSTGHDVKGNLDTIASACSCPHFLKISHPRLLNAEALARRWGGGSSIGTVEDALLLARDGPLVFCGSVFMMDAVLERMGVKSPRDPLFLQEQGVDKAKTELLDLSYHR